MGGLLSNPATKFPGLFDVPLFRRYPYLLPCIAATSIAWTGCVYGFFYLKEVRIYTHRQPNYPIASCLWFMGGRLADASQQTVEGPEGTNRDVRVPGRRVREATRPAGQHQVSALHSSRPCAVHKRCRLVIHVSPLHPSLCGLVLWFIWRSY